MMRISIEMKEAPQNSHHLLMVSLILIFFVVALSCTSQEKDSSQPPVMFNQETLKIPDKGVRKLRGQVVYMPVYSNIPYHGKEKFDLSAFLAIHNTDLKHQIRVTKVIFFNTEGKVVKHFISEDRILNPFATETFEIGEKDQSGTGANFLIEWIADQPVNEPLIESIMKDLTGNRGLSFLSVGRVIREIE